MTDGLLFTPLTIRNVTFRNRIFSTGHQTNMNIAGLPGDRMIDYQAAKAKGGAGLVITESSRAHPSSFQAGWVLNAASDDCIEPLTKLAARVHEHGCKIFGQLGHPGAVSIRMIDDIRREVYSASAMRDDRFRNVARPLSLAQIEEIVDAYAIAARRYQSAGYDGIEVMVSHGVLPAQFLNPHFNKRTDHYGGSLENRLRFTADILSAIRAATGDEFVIGIRISMDEKEDGGLLLEQSLPACVALDTAGLADYFNVTAGTMASAGGSVHVVPPMTYETGYVTGDSNKLKDCVKAPVFVAGRINQPQIAERILQSGQADMCGMTRAMIADPDMARKARAGQYDDIVACIGCNQACIGHLHSGAPISCIQTPSTGREALGYQRTLPKERRSVVVIGGGPAGMKAAATAAERGHEVELIEAASRLGGQALLAQLLPGRSEFGGLVTNLERQLKTAGVTITTATAATPEMIKARQPDAVILATGAVPFGPDADAFEGAHVVDAWAVLRDKVNVGQRVVIADWRSDWIGLGLAEKLAAAGCSVRLAVTSALAGEAVQQYARDDWMGRLHRLGVEIVPYARLHGADTDTVYFQHTTSGQPIVLENADTLVTALGHVPVTSLEDELGDLGLDVHVVGDCLSPRSAEEAIYEGWMAGLKC